MQLPKSPTMMALPVILALALPLAWLATSDDAAGAGKYSGGAVSGGGTVSGTVLYAGPKPAAKKLKVTKDHGTCGAAKDSEELLVGSGGALGNVVVSLEGISQGKPLKKALAVLDQQKCVYLPHVQAVAKGSKIELRNSDGILHNIHGKDASGGVVFNVAMPLKDQKVTKKLRKAGLVTIGCDAGHTWMSAYVHVFAHPYFAVTDASGKFSLGDVPPGSYKLVAWHEKLGTKTSQVTVTAGGQLTEKVTFK